MARSCDAMLVHLADRGELHCRTRQSRALAVEQLACADEGHRDPWLRHEAPSVYGASHPQARRANCLDTQPPKSTSRPRAHSNAVPYLLVKKRAWYSKFLSSRHTGWICAVCSVFSHTVVRVSQIMGEVGNPEESWEIGGGWVALVAWDSAGPVLAMAHFVGGIMVGSMQSDRLDPAPKDAPELFGTVLTCSTLHAQRVSLLFHHHHRDHAMRTRTPPLLLHMGPSK